jgi:hypothetical protein
MASASFILSKQLEDPAATRRPLSSSLAFANGDRLAEEPLRPMPDNVVGAIRRLCAEIKDAGGKPLVARPN